MEINTKDTAVRSLRRKAMFLRILSAFLAAAAIGSVFLYRNPWLVHRLDAEQVSASILAQVAESRSPYIRIDGITLNYTGFYKVSNDGVVRSYCYMGAIGDEYILVDLPAKDDGALAEDDTLENRTLKDYTLYGQLVQTEEMTRHLAEAEEMQTDEYKAYYRVVDVELRNYGSDQERMRIYQLMLLILAVGALAVGQILISESRIAENESKEKDI